MSGHMRVAVILSGALRTIKKTVRYLKANVLLTPDHDLFLCVQNDTSQSEEEWTTWWHQEVGPWIRSLVWFSKERMVDWSVHRERLLAHMPLEETWKNYLRNSGSMIEYAQLHIAYLDLVEREYRCGWRYDYVVRARTDSIYTKPVDFHWLQWSDDDVASRMGYLRAMLRVSGKDVTDQMVMTYFMATLLSDDVLSNIEHIHATYQPHPAEGGLPSCAAALRSYLHTGRYMLTLRKNNLYLCPRASFYMIPSLGHMYGQFRSPYSDNYWFNAEGQFRDACYYSCVSVFDYTTDFEEKSLEYAHQWNESLFFNAEGLPHPHMLYCVVRK